MKISLKLHCAKPSLKYTIIAHLRTQVHFLQPNKTIKISADEQLELVLSWAPMQRFCYDISGWEHKFMRLAFLL